MLMFEQGDYMFTFDLKSGYQYTNNTENSWCFSWNLGLAQQFYVFCVLPFGLATACYLFTKLL